MTRSRTAPEAEQPVRADGVEPAVPGRRRLRDRKILLVVLAVLLVALLAVAGALAWAVLTLDRNVERLPGVFDGLEERPVREQPAVSSPEEPGEPLNMLVLGTDSRISAGDPNQWEAGAQRTDVMMLVHLSGDRGSGYVMSIPRDSWVPIPGHGEAKINAAFSFGGPSLLIQTVEDLTGVRVDHFAVTDFESFRRITDAMGGVRITLDSDLRDRGQVVLPAGDHLMTGDEALLWVRQRMNLPRGDFDRVQRQQAWIRAMVSRVRDRQILQDPARWYPLLDAVTESVAVDEELSRARMVDLLMEVRDLGNEDLAFFTVPIEGTGWSADRQSIVVLDRPAFDDLMAAVREDRVGEYLQENPETVDRLGSRVP